MASQTRRTVGGKGTCARPERKEEGSTKSSAGLICRCSSHAPRHCCQPRSYKWQHCRQKRTQTCGVWAPGGASRSCKKA
eukprot:2447726-Rhodomonas_salina.1